MSTVIENQQGQPPQDDKWILDREISEELVLPEGAQPVEPAQPVAPGALPGQGVEYTTETGHTFRGKDWNEIVKQMEGAVLRSATLAANYQTELQQARTTTSQQTAFDRGGARQAQEPAEEFKSEKYYELLADKKPLEANNYLMRTGYGITDLREQVTTAYSIAQKTRDRFEVADFMSNNPDYPASDHAAALLLQRLDREGVVVNRWNLETAKNQLYAEGSLRPVNVSGPAPTPAPAPAPVARGAMAPPVPRSQGQEFAERDLTDTELENLTLEQHRSYLRKKGLNV